MAGSHFRAHMLDRLEAADHSSELFALPGIVDRFFDHSLARTEAIGGQEHPAGVPQAPDCGPTIVRESLARYARKPQLPYAPGAVDRFESNLLQTRSIASYDNIRSPRYARYVSRTAPTGYVTRTPAATNMARSSAISRGGLGSSARSFGRGG